MIKPHNLIISATTASYVDMETLFATAYASDTVSYDIFLQIRNGVQRSKHISLANWIEQNGRLLYQYQVYVPAYRPLILRLLQLNYNRPAAGHPGLSKTIELLQQQYY